MVLCWIALPIFAFLGIFSVKYRKLTMDALDCFFRTVTLRKCHSGLDKRIKAHITGTILKYSPSAAKFVQKHYTILSWIMIILFFWSLITASIGVYNFIEYGNCNGPDSTGFCIFDPTGQNSGVSEIDTLSFTTHTIPKVDETDPIRGDRDAPITIIEFGCYSCEYTRHAEPVIQEVLEQYSGKVNVQFKSFVIPGHSLSRETIVVGECAYEIDSKHYWDYHDKLMTSELTSEEEFFVLAEDVGIDAELLKNCYYNASQNGVSAEVNADISSGIEAGISGTPTFFIGNKTIVGPKPLRTFEHVINTELKRLGVE